MQFGADITDYMRNSSKRFQEERARAQYKANYTGLEKPNRFYDGRIAEFVFEEILKKLELAHDYRGDTVPDLGDFKIAQDVVDVKFVPYNGSLFLHNLAEWDKVIKKDFYVPIKIDREYKTGVAYGYFTRTEVEQMPHELDCCDLCLNKLTIASKHASIFDAHPLEQLFYRWG